MSGTPKRKVGRPKGATGRARKNACLVKMTDGEKLRLKELAGTMPLATYLRERGMGQR